MRSLVYILLFAMLLLSSCDKDESANPKLPAATQTGARTFGCLVDGKVFVHNDGVINCFYQWIDGGYYFGVHGKNDAENPTSIFVGTYDHPLIEGETYVLTEHELDNVFGGVFFSFLNRRRECAHKFELHWRVYGYKTGFRTKYYFRNLLV